jgi:hypothetical protein
MSTNGPRRTTTSGFFFRMTVKIVVRVERVKRKKRTKKM